LDRLVWGKEKARQDLEPVNSNSSAYFGLELKLLNGGGGCVETPFMASKEASLLQIMEFIKRNGNFWMVQGVLLIGWVVGVDR
jgi:hypothetical protein